MLTIVIFYLLNYYLNDKYEISYSHYKYYKNQDEFINQKNEAFNNFNFSYDLYKITKDAKQEKLDYNFELFNSAFNMVPKNSYINSKIKDMTFYIVYICLENCSLNTDNDIVFAIELNYSGYKIDHQSEEIPLETHNINLTFSKTLHFSIEKTDIFEINFENIRYREEKGLLGLFDNWIDKKKIIVVLI